MTDIKYYSYDNDDGFEEYETEEQAKDAAESSLASRDEFDEDDEIEYGVMIPLGRLVEKNRRDTPENQEEADWWQSNGWSYVCDHEIATVTTLNHHLANEFVRLRSQLEEMKTGQEDSEAWKLLAELERSLARQTANDKPVRYSIAIKSIRSRVRKLLEKRKP